PRRLTRYLAVRPSGGHTSQRGPAGPDRKIPTPSRNAVRGGRDPLSLHDRMDLVPGSLPSRARAGTSPDRGPPRRLVDRRSRTRDPDSDEDELELCRLRGGATHHDPVQPTGRRGHAGDPPGPRTTSVVQVLYLLARRGATLLPQSSAE